MSTTNNNTTTSSAAAAANNFTPEIQTVSRNQFNQEKLDFIRGCYIPYKLQFWISEAKM